MSKVAFNTPISGNGMVTFDVPPTNSFNTLTIPDESGNLLTSENPVVSKLNGGPLAGFRNRIINGNFSVWQRGTAFTSTAGTTYTADRWAVADAGAGLAVAYGSEAGVNFIKKTGAAGHTTGWFLQRIESDNCIDLVDKTITVKANVYSSVPLTTVQFSLHYPTAKDNFTTITTIGAFGTTTHSGSGWVTISATINNLPAGVANGLALFIEHSALTSGEVRIAKVQLEEGEVATPFEFRYIGTELDMCKRYYEASVNLHMFRLSDTPALTTSWVFSVAKRATPTISITDGAGNANRVTIEATQNVTYGSAPSPSTNGVAWNSTLGSGVSGNLCYFRWVATAEL